MNKFKYAWIVLPLCVYSDSSKAADVLLQRLDATPSLTSNSQCAEEYREYRVYGFDMCTLGAAGDQNALTARALYDALWVLGHKEWNAMMVAYQQPITAYSLSAMAQRRGMRSYDTESEDEEQ
jgi:hypothetical protein